MILATLSNGAGSAQYPINQNNSQKISPATTTQMTALMAPVLEIIAIMGRILTSDQISVYQEKYVSPPESGITKSRPEPTDRMVAANAAQATRFEMRAAYPVSAQP